MSQWKRCLFVVTALALAACQEGDEIPDCGASALQERVGQSVETIRWPEGARVIGPDTAITRDYRIDRLNIDHDQSGVITRIWCG